MLLVVSMHHGLAVMAVDDGSAIAIRQDLAVTVLDGFAVIMFLDLAVTAMDPAILEAPELADAAKAMSPAKSAMLEVLEPGQMDVSGLSLGREACR